MKRRIYHRFGASQFSGMILICFLGERLPPKSSEVDLRADERSPSRKTGFRPACRTAERPRQKQVGQAPSGNRDAARQRVHPEVHREALQFFACQPRKLAEEARIQETEAVKSYGGFGTFEPLGPPLCQPEDGTKGITKKLTIDTRNHGSESGWIRFVVGSCLILKKPFGPGENTVRSDRFQIHTGTVLCNESCTVRANNERPSCSSKAQQIFRSVIGIHHKSFNILILLSKLFLSQIFVPIWVDPCWGI